MSRRTLRFAALTTLTALPLFAACTPDEVAQWNRWRAEDPAAAEAHVDEVVAAAAPEVAAAPAVASGGVWDRLAECESGGDWSIDTGNGFYGGVQFHPDTWRAMGGGEFAPQANQATREQQIAVAERVLDEQGWGAWPSCSSQLGLR